MNRDEKIIYENERGQSIEFSVWSPFFISYVEGINGLKNTIYTSKSMGQDGSTFIDSTLDNRNIVIQGAITSSKEMNGNKLLSIINPKLKAKLIYVNKDIKKYADCIVETAPVVTKDNNPKFYISLLANNPFWQDISVNKEDIALWVGDFQFPLEIFNEGIEIGHREPSLIVNVNNAGDVTTGMKIEFRALGTVINPSLFNVNTREFIKINKTMVQGEKLIITTTFGKKKVESSLNGIVTNAFNYIDLESTFLQLDVGDNLLRYDAGENLDNLEVSIYYTSQYLGV